MNDEQFEELDIFQVASLLWKAKKHFDPIIMGSSGIIHQITNIECIDGDIYINVHENKVLNDHVNKKDQDKK